MGTGGMGHIGNRDTGGNGVQEVWVIWAMRPTGGMGYRGMGQMGNRGTGVWGTRGMGHMGNGYMDNGVQGYGQLGTWAMGPMGNLHPKCQKDVKLSKRCQVVKKISNVKKSNT